MKQLLKLLVSLIGIYFIGAVIFLFLSLFKPGLYSHPLWEVLIAYIVLGGLAYEVYETLYNQEKS